VSIVRVTSPILRSGVTPSVDASSQGQQAQPPNADIPALEALFVEESDDHANPLAAKGIGGGAMDDAKVLRRINELAREEHELFERESRPNVSEADRERLREIQVTLDQCWDLLRQRRARRAAGLEPDDARVRDEKTVEGYTG
jgi:hypothetical protein